MSKQYPLTIFLESPDQGAHLRSLDGQGERPAGTLASIAASPMSGQPKGLDAMLDACMITHRDFSGTPVRGPLMISSYVLI